MADQPAGHPPGGAADQSPADPSPGAEQSSTAAGPGQPSAVPAGGESSTASGGGQPSTAPAGQQAAAPDPAAPDPAAPAPAPDPADPPPAGQSRDEPTGTDSMRGGPRTSGQDDARSEVPASELFADRLIARVVATLAARMVPKYQIHFDGPAAPVIGDGGSVDGAGPAGQRARGALWTEPVDRLESRLSTFVEPPSFRDLSRQLRDCPVVELAGPASSGRVTAACAALVEWHGRDRVHEVKLPPDGDPRAIRDQPKLLSEAHGYVIRLAKDSATGLIGFLSQTFKQHRAHAVLIRLADTSDENGHHAQVFHQHPEPMEVFRRHLRAGLGSRCVGDCPNCTGDCIGQYMDFLLALPAITAAIGGLVEPRQCARYAGQFAAEVPRDPADVERLLPPTVPEVEQRRQTARKILLAPGTDADHENRSSQHRRALRIAYATLNGRPLAQVSEAAGLLLRRVDDLFGRDYYGRPALVYDIAELLGDELGGGLTAADEAARAPDAVASRVARIADELTLDILDVAWNDFDNTQPVLVEWIDDLARHANVEFAPAAMKAAMIFAYHDFDLLHQRILQPWATHPRPKLRQLAAGTMVLAAHLPTVMPWAVSTRQRIEPRADTVLHDLALSDRTYERDTAALAWAMGYPPRGSWPTRMALTAVARGNGGRFSQNVTDAVERVAEYAGLAWTVVLLTQWAGSDDPTLRAQAAQSFLRLAGRVPAGSDDPELLALVSTEPRLADQVARLWRLVLLDPPVPGGVRLSLHAWGALADWFRHARIDDGHTTAVTELLRQLAADPAIRRRLDHWLSRRTAARRAGPATRTQQPQEVR